MIKNPFRKFYKELFLFSQSFVKSRARQENIEFDQEVQRLHHMQSVSKRLYKDMRKCSESEAAQVKANTKLCSDLCTSTAAKSEPLKSTVECISGCSEELQEHYKEHRLRQDTTFTEPIKKFHNLYKHLDVHTKQRDTRLQELEKQQMRLEKCQSSQSISPAKLELTQRNLQSAKGDYEKIHLRLMSEMPQLYEGRVDFFEPCLTAVMQSQLVYHEDCVQTLSSSLTQLEAMNGKDQLTMEEHFTRIKSLSIVGDNG